MSRYEEIKVTARHIAGSVHTDPALRDAMANGLIKLVGLMLEAQGSGVTAIGGYSEGVALSREFDPDTECIEYSTGQIAEMRAEFESEKLTEANKYHAVRLAGDALQSSARGVMALYANASTVADPCVQCLRRSGHRPGCPNGSRPCRAEGNCQLSGDLVCLYHH